MWRGYFSFMRGAKSANSELFKDFCNEAEMEKNKSNGVLYFVIVPNISIFALPKKRDKSLNCLTAGIPRSGKSVQSKE